VFLYSCLVPKFLILPPPPPVHQGVRCQFPHPFVSQATYLFYPCSRILEVVPFFVFFFLSTFRPGLSNAAVPGCPGFFSQPCSSAPTRSRCTRMPSFGGPTSPRCCLSLETYRGMYEATPRALLDLDTWPRCTPYPGLMVETGLPGPPVPPLALPPFFERRRIYR